MSFQLSGLSDQPTLLPSPYIYTRTEEWSLCSFALKRGKVIQPVLIKAIPQSAKVTAMWMTPRAETAHSPCLTLFTSTKPIFKTNCANYSKTSNNGPSEKWTTSVQRTANLPLIDFTIELIHFESEKRTPLNSEQRTLIRPRRTLTNTKLPPKTDSKVTPT